MNTSPPVGTGVSYVSLPEDEHDAEQQQKKQHQQRRRSSSIVLFDSDAEAAVLGADVDRMHKEGGSVKMGTSEEDMLPTYKRTIVITTAMFMGYAVLVSFQKKLKVKYGIRDGSSHLSDEFSFAVSFLYIGNLVFRLAHNFVFAPIRPRNRVYVAMISMAISMLILGVFIFTLDYTSTLAWVYVAYVLGGVGIGSFESNLLSAITPLGHNTKMWAILGFPIGFALILIGGFFATALGVPPVAIYFAVLAMLVIACITFAFGIPVVEIENNAESLSSFVDNLRNFRKWLPAISWNCLALMCDMFAVALFSGVMLYIFNDGKDVPLFGKNSKTLVSHDGYFVVYNLFTLLGDSLSRKVAYWARPRHPMLFLVLSAVGAVICLIKVPIIAPLGIFLVFFANGSVYATTTRHIDMHVPNEFNLIALSFWLFIGDIGSVGGSNVIPYLRNWVCRHHSPHLCVADS